jgi:pimeloyl-ACP methyl ester carboxylesterase
MYPPDSPAIIHLHGFGISGTYLLPAADLLAKDYRTYVPDLHGYGRSIHPDRVLSIPELGVAVVHFMDAAGIERATLVGNSMGCMTAIETAQAAPDRVERVVLISPAGGPFNRPIFKGVAQLALDGLREPPRMFTIAVPDYLRFGFINAGKLFWQMIHYPTIDRFKATSKPALVILGERDPLVNEARIVNGTADNPAISIVRVDGAAHAINYSHPRKVTHLVRQFVEGQLLTDDGEARGTAVIIKQRQLSP